MNIPEKMIYMNANPSTPSRLQVYLSELLLEFLDAKAKAIRSFDRRVMVSYAKANRN